MNTWQEEELKTWKQKELEEKCNRESFTENATFCRKVGDRNQANGKCIKCRCI